MLRMKSTIHLTGQANHNDQSACGGKNKNEILSATINRFRSLNIGPPKAEIFICNLVLEIWDFIV